MPVTLVFGDAEATPDEAARNVFEVDFWGAVHVSQEAVRFFREENSPQGGRLIQNSAAVGLVTREGLAFYGAAKHALEAFTETLSKEVNSAWNIKITSVLPGGFVTDITTSGQLIPQHPAYADDSNAVALVRKMFIENASMEAMNRLGCGDPAKGVQKIYKLSKLPDPPLRVLLGRDSNYMVKEWHTQLGRETEEYAHWSDSLGFEVDK
ncbi:NAD(P)-binding protein [Dichomitus squalens]|uniref:NAD(P)-binding protein n=1 Tax=Dichomitus squalens TaxID=114155 RepID=A0A4Q9Q1A0_9APHY|nr:NAD(P)-binding protein [Dichomitus squalens]TBU60334.1 NAD(P)-binding protein [Dichomitus squalens]